MRKLFFVILAIFINFIFFLGLQDKAEAYGDFSCTVTGGQSSNNITASLSATGDITDYNRLSWQLKDNDNFIYEDSAWDITGTTTPFSRNYTFANPVLGSTTKTYTIVISFWDINNVRSGTQCTTSYTNTSIPGPDTSAFGPITGRVTDLLDNPISGITVFAKNSKSALQGDLPPCPSPEPNVNGRCYSTVTDASGNFSFDSAITQALVADPDTICGLQEYAIRLNRADLTARGYDDPKIKIVDPLNPPLEFFCGDPPDACDSCAGTTLTDWMRLSYERQRMQNRSCATTGGCNFLVGKNNDAICDSIAPPYDAALTANTVYAGQSYTSSVTMKNTGWNTWTSVANYNLGSQDVQDNTIWRSNRVDYSNAATYPVNTDQSVIYTFPVTAPSTAGDYNFNWQMIQDGVAWFGQKCASTVTVIAPPTGSITGPTSGYVASPLSYTASLTAGSGSSLTKGRIYVAPKNADGTPGAWTLLKEETTNPSSFSTIWNPTATGIYYVTINGYGRTYGTDQEVCSGNPDPLGLPIGWEYCDRPTTPHLNDYKTVTISSPIPSLGALNISPDSASSARGSESGFTYGTSGLREDQGGKNAYNALKIKQTIANGSVDNYDLAGVVFTRSSLRPAVDSDLATLKQSADANNGFILLYANCSGNATCIEDGKTFTKDLYYLYYHGVWYDDLQLFPRLRGLDNYVKVAVGNYSNPPTAPEFSVYLYNGLGSRTWGTYGYLKYGSTTKSQSLTPS